MKGLYGETKDAIHVVEHAVVFLFTSVKRDIRPRQSSP